MAQLWSDNTLNRLAQVVEEETTSRLEAVVDRLALNIVAGQYDYLLPDYISAISRATWIGYELNPRTRLDQIRSQSTPFMSSQNMPREYIISGVGYNIIRLLPTPNINLPDPGGDYFDPSVYMNACVLQFTRVPDITNYQLRIPDFLQRLFFKDAILFRALSMEGKGQDLKGAEYFGKKASYMYGLLSEIKQNLWLYCPKYMSPNPSQVPRISHPVLPPNFPAR